MPSRLVATLLCLPLAAMAAPAVSQDKGPASRAELDRQSAEAMTASEAKVKAWFADPEVQALKAKADGGDAAAQVAFGDRIRKDILGEIWSRDTVLQNMLKYYALAMAQDHGPAFARVGEFAESVDYFSTLGRTRDRNEALTYFEKGAELGDRDAVAGYARIALDPVHCSFCEDNGEFRYDRKKVEAAGLGAAGDTELDRAYRSEKFAAASKAARLANPVRLRADDAAAHFLAQRYLEGVKVPYTAVGKAGEPHPGEYLLAPDGEKAVNILIAMSQRGDILASRKLGALYLVGAGKGSPIIFGRDPDKYIFYMKRAADNGSVIAASDLGFMLLAGKDIPANHAVGFDLVAKAAIAGYGPAELNAAYALREGRGAPKDEKLALQLFERAAGHAEIDGAVQAAAMYRAGQGTESGRPDPAMAQTYEKKAGEMRSLSPQMADLIRRGHREKFQ